MLREYECMLILPAEADEATVGTAVDRIAKTIAPTGGKVDSIDRWGRRRFAYEIARQHEGYYVVVRFEAEPSVQSELDHTLKLADEVIRTRSCSCPTRYPRKRRQPLPPPQRRRKRPRRGTAPWRATTRSRSSATSRMTPSCATRRTAPRWPTSGSRIPPGSVTRPATGRTATHRSSRSTAGGAWPRTPRRRSRAAAGSW